MICKGSALIFRLKCLDEQGVDLPGDIAFQTAHDFVFAPSFGHPAVKVVLGRLVVPHQLAFAEQERRRNIIHPLVHALESGLHSRPGTTLGKQCIHMLGRPQPVRHLIGPVPFPAGPSDPGPARRPTDRKRSSSSVRWSFTLTRFARARTSVREKRAPHRRW